MLEKLKALFFSRRFWAALAGVLLVVCENLGLPVTESQIQMLVMLVASWIIGDSLRSTVVLSTSDAAKLGIVKDVSAS